VLPVEDEEISAFARKSFEKQGIKIHTAAALTALNDDGDTIATRIEANGKAFEERVERVIIAVGIVGNVEDIGLENTGVAVDKARAGAGGRPRPGAPSPAARGVRSAPRGLAQRASHEGVICVERTAGVNDVPPRDVQNTPACTYCRPQVASVGLTEKTAREA